jgi:secretion/DNA translocation related CpaE-like protein
MSLVGGATESTARHGCDTRVQRTVPTRRTVPGEDVPLVITGDLELLDGVLAAAAAAAVEPSVTSEAASIRPTWASAPMVIVGLDRVRQVWDLMLPRRREIYVVGDETNQQELWQWSAPLGAAIVALPSGAGLLTAAIADLAARPGEDGLTVAVVAGSGGVGASTIAAGLCCVAAADTVSSMLVDLDPFGGGIDLLVGAESLPGWRWPRLQTAQGHLGDLTGHVPRVAGMDVLSASRDDDHAPAELGTDSVRAVLLSTSRSHRLTVADLPRAMTASSREVLQRAQRTLLVVPANVRGIAAAQQFRSQLLSASSDLRVVVRTPRSGGVDAGMVSDAVELQLAGVVGEDSSLTAAADRGEPPGRSGRSPIGKLARRLLADLPGEVQR